MVALEGRDREAVAKNHSGLGPPTAPQPTCMPTPAWLGVPVVSQPLGVLPCGQDECQKQGHGCLCRREPLSWWDGQHVALGLACLKTSGGALAVLCAGQLWAFLGKMLLISAAGLHGGKRSLKTALVCRKKSLKRGKKS